MDNPETVFGDTPPNVHREEVRVYRDRQWEWRVQFNPRPGHGRPWILTNGDFLGSMPSDAKCDWSYMQSYSNETSARYWCHKLNENEKNPDTKARAKQRDKLLDKALEDD